MESAIRIRKNQTQNKNDFVLFYIPVVIIVIGLVLRLIIRSSSLWEDEIIATTAALEPVLRIIVRTAFGEVHPPLYFLQLHVWAFISHADAWFIANSIFYSLIAMGSMFVAIRRLNGPAQALITTAIFSVLPVTIWMSGEVRMYALLSVMFIWIYYFMHKIFVLKERSTKFYAALTLLSIAVVYTHAIGFIAVLFFGIYAASWLVTQRAGRRDWIMWLILFSGIGIIALPMLASDAIQKADMPPLTSFQDICNWMASVVTGEGYKFNAWLRDAGLATYLIIVIAGTIVSRTRRLTLCFLVAPIALSIIVGLMARPLFKTNFFSNFLSIFFALVIGEFLILLSSNKIWRSIVLCIVCASLLTMAITNRLILNVQNNYFHQIARLIETEEQPGDIVWAPQADMFWGLNWYLIGPEWGTPVLLTEPLRPQSGWWKVFHYLGPKWVEKLGLTPTAQSVDTKNGITIMTSSSNRARAEQAKRVWLVTYPRSDLKIESPEDELGPLQHSGSFFFPPLQVNLYELPDR